MSRSAFGVEHGEFSKAMTFKPPRPPKMRVPSMLKSGGGARRGAGPAAGPMRQAGNFLTGAKSGIQGGSLTPFKGAAQTGAQFGAGVRRIGMNRGVQIGAAGVGGAYGGSQMGNNKKLKQYR